MNGRGYIKTYIDFVWAHIRHEVLNTAYQTAMSFSASEEQTDEIERIFDVAQADIDREFEPIVVTMKYQGEPKI